MNLTAYPEYKGSHVEWLGEVPKHWECMPVKFALSMPITDGPHETPDKLDEGIPFVSAEAVRHGRLDFSKKWGFISQESHNRFAKKYKPARGDVYMVKSGATTGNVAKVDTDADFNIWSPLAVLRPDGYRTTTNFLHYFMQSKPFRHSVELAWSFGTQQNIGMGVISNLLISSPPPKEQQAIADYLDNKTGQIDALIGKKKALIDRLKEQRTALITAAVTKGIPEDGGQKTAVRMKDSGIEWLGQIPEHWEVRRLKFAATCNDETLSEKTDPDYEIEYVDISSVSITDGITKTDRMEFEKAPSRARRKIQDGDSIISTVRTYLKSIASIRQPPENLIASTGFAVVRPMKFIAPSFLSYYVQSQGFVDAVVANSTGVSYPAINPTDLVCLEVVYPEGKDEQQAIADYLDQKTGKIDGLIGKAEEVIQRLEEYRTAVITAAVTGKICIPQVLEYAPDAPRLRLAAEPPATYGTNREKE